MSDLIFYSKKTGAAKAIKVGDRTTELLLGTHFYRIGYATKVLVVDDGEEIEILAVELSEKVRSQMNNILIESIAREVGSLLPNVRDFTTALEYKKAMAIALNLSRLQQLLDDRDYQYLDLDTETT
jgi:hypothetical protein